MSNKKEIRQELTKIHTEKTQYELEKLKKSFRWRCGNAIARFIEILLFRKREKLAIDFIEDHLKTINSLNDTSTETLENKLKLPETIESIYFLVKVTDVENSFYGDPHVANDLRLALKQQLPNTKVGLHKYNKDFGPHKNAILINMLWYTYLPPTENYNLAIAWIRNFPDKWAENPDFLKYDIYLCSSEKMAEFISRLTDKPVYIFPIAANINRFKPSNPTTDKIVYVGNKWAEERVIDRFLETKNHNVNAYGKDQKNKIISNTKIPQLYANSKIVLDAANQSTFKWASLNSRVFNAIASKRLILSNSLEATKLFRAEIPTYNNEDDLEKQISFYLKNKDAYDSTTDDLLKELQHHHTFEHRAEELKLILSSKINIAIKVAAPEKTKYQFGDWYFAKSLAKHFEYYGHNVRIDWRENWMNNETLNDDLVIVLRGLKAYQPLKSQTNFLWLISHPEMVTLSEMQQYQHCFIASDFHYEKLQQQNINNISVLHQCTDVNLFYPLNEVDQKEDALLFVGNSRNVYRNCVRYAIELGIPIHVYGSLWKQFIPTKYIKGEFVENEKLNELYNRYSIVLNDHWDDMLDYGYASNRMFDVTASGATLLSDQPKSTEKLPPGVHYFSDKASFKAKVNQLKKQAILKNKKGAQQVYNFHSFKKRAQHILHQYYELNKNYSVQMY